jgi:MYXO-CTERM domain-containing protein
MDATVTDGEVDAMPDAGDPGSGGGCAVTGSPTSSLGSFALVAACFGLLLARRRRRAVAVRA